MTLNEAKTLLEENGFVLENASELEDGFNAWCMELERILQDRHDFTDRESSYLFKQGEKYVEHGP